jgi:hypothetical protein
MPKKSTVESLKKELEMVEKIRKTDYELRLKFDGLYGISNNSLLRSIVRKRSAVVEQEEEDIDVSSLSVKRMRM